MTLQDFKGPVGVLAVSMFLDFTGFTLLIPVIPFLVGRYVPTTRVALIVCLIISVYALCQFVAAPILGALSDRLGRRRILLTCLLGSVLGYLVFGLASVLWVLFAGRIIAGLTGGSISTLFAYVADVIEPRKRGLIYGILGAAGGFGFIVGPAIGGLAGQCSLSAPAFIAALLALGNAAWAYYALPESLPREKRTADFGWSHLNPLAPFGHILGDSHLLTIFSSSFLFFLAGTILQGNFSVFLKDLLGFGPGGIGILLLAVGIMDIVSQGYLSGKLLPLCGESLLARVGLGINAVGCLMIAAIAYVPSLILLFASIVIFVLGDGLFQPAINGLISNSGPPNMQGRVQGANQAQQALARMIGPLLGSTLYLLGAALPYAGGALLIMISLGILLLRPKTMSPSNSKAIDQVEVSSAVQN
jgi:MFS transporter, DHA1 family, tetracycline resistance protein